MDEISQEKDQLSNLLRQKCEEMDQMKAQCQSFRVRISELTETINQEKKNQELESEKQNSKANAELMNELEESRRLNQEYD